jgi:hypothetical protein
MRMRSFSLLAPCWPEWPAWRKLCTPALATHNALWEGTAWSSAIVNISLLKSQLQCELNLAIVVGGRPYSAEG